MGGAKSISARNDNQDDLYRGAVEQFGPALERLARAYEADPEKRRDLSQDIHLQLWRSFQLYDGRCSVRTWVYRIAHHVAASYVIRERRILSSLVTLEELEALPDKAKGPEAAYQRVNLDRLADLILLWSLGSILLALATFILGLAMIGTKDRGLIPNGLPFLVLVVAWIFGYFVVRARELRQLQHEIDELNDLPANRPTFFPAGS